jgi:hypothetical protein
MGMREYGVWGLMLSEDKIKECVPEEYGRLQSALDEEGAALEDIWRHLEGADLLQDEYDNADKILEAYKQVVDEVRKGMHFEIYLTQIPSDSSHEDAGKVFWTTDFFKFAPELEALEPNIVAWSEVG